MVCTHGKPYTWNGKYSTTEGEVYHVPSRSHLQFILHVITADFTQKIPSQGNSRYFLCLQNINPQFGSQKSSSYA